MGKKLKMFLVLVSCSCFLISCGDVVNSSSTEVSSSSGNSETEVKEDIETTKNEDGILVKLSKENVEAAGWVFSNSQPYYYHVNTKVIYFRIGDYYYELKTAEGTNYLWEENSRLFVGVELY